MRSLARVIGLLADAFHPARGLSTETIVLRAGAAEYRRAYQASEQAGLEFGLRLGALLSGRPAMEACACGEGERGTRRLLFDNRTGVGVCAACDRYVTTLR